MPSSKMEILTSKTHLVLAVQLSSMKSDWTNFCTKIRVKRQKCRELAEKMECSYTTIEKHLHSMGKVHNCGESVPHALSDNNKNQRATISTGLLARHRSTHGHKQRFLYRIVTGDEKWWLYINMKQRKEWLSSGKLRTLIKSKKKEVSKMLIFLNLTFHFNDLKINKS